MRHGGFRECVNSDCVNFDFGSFEFACAIGQLPQRKQSQHSKLTLANFSPDAFIPHDRALLHARCCS